jgi:single-strand DNA-binding protein
VGRLGQTPELDHTQNNVPYAKFSIATERQFTKEDITDWHNVTAWGKTAETIAQHLKKGQEIYLEGRIEYNKVGDKIYANVTADSFSFLGKKEANES